MIIEKMANVKGNIVDIPVVGMLGLGNFFMVIDNREKKYDLSLLLEYFSTWKVNHCDQLIVLEKSDTADAFMRIYNKDGGEVEACGNATRCVGGLLMDRDENGSTEKTIETVAGMLKTWRSGTPEERMISVDMGEPKLEWQDIPLSEEMDTLNVDIFEEDYVQSKVLSEYEGKLPNGIAVNVGNPHIVFLFKDYWHYDAIAKTGDIVEKYDLGIKIQRIKKQMQINGILAEKIENLKLFPNKVNVNFASMIGEEIHLIVWERGVGETAACGTGACATLVAAVRKGLTDRKATVIQPGGDLIIEWSETTNRITMTGEYQYETEFTITKIYDQ